MLLDVLVSKSVSHYTEVLMDGGNPAFCGVFGFYLTPSVYPSPTGLLACQYSCLSACLVLGVCMYVYVSRGRLPTVMGWRGSRQLPFVAYRKARHVSLAGHSALL